MVNNDQRNESIEGGAPVDEAWWMSVLNSVENQSKPAIGKIQKSASQTESNSQFSLSQTTKNESEAMDQDWDKAQKLYEQDEAIELKVTGYNRGGLLVEANELKGFVPVSHLIQISRKCSDENDLKEYLEAYIGKTLQLKVIECAKNRGRVVFSERAAQSDSGRRIQLLDDLKEGDCLHGNITTITNFGAFVDLGGIEGLIHISELSWGRVQHPKEIVSAGQQVEVAVLEIDRQRSRIALSLKRMLPNPWDTIEDCCHPGQMADATITSVVSFGAFARLDSGVDGLIHASEIAGNGQNNFGPENILNKGQRVQVCILNIDPQRQRLGLSLEKIYD
jgi:small subunit ribosomal protein S1